MYGIKNEQSIICKLQRPETKIGRHGSNNIIISTTSRKISRFHAVIEFLNETPLIKDISEWGVFVNDLRVCKHRWAELKAGDKIALGASTKEDGACMLEVVVWEPEDKICSSTNRQIEVIDITEEDDDEVIELSDDESNTATPGEETPSICNVEDGNIISTSSSKEEETISNPISEVLLSSLNGTAVSSNQIQPNPSTKIEALLKDSTISTNENEPALLNEIEIPSKDSAITSSDETEPDIITEIEMPLEDSEKIEPKFIDVTLSMNGLLKQNSVEQAFEYPNALQSIMDYSSDEEDYTMSFYDSTNLTVHDDVESDKKCVNKDIGSHPGTGQDLEENVHKRWSSTVKEDIHKGWSEPHKQFSRDACKSPASVNYYTKSSDDSSPSTSDETKKAHIVHKTLLTSKIAKIAVIQPLPNKSVVSRCRKRVRSESPDTIYQRLVDSERTQKSSSDDPNAQKRLTSELSDLPPKVKSVCRKQPLIAVARKQAREKVKALYPTPPIEVKRTAITRPQPKVKVTEKNRGDFLTREEVPSVHRSLLKPADVAINDEVIPDKPTTEVDDKPIKPINYVDVISNKSTTSDTTQEDMEEPPASLNTSDEHRKSVGEILNDIELHTVAINDSLSEIVPPIKSARTIEVSVNFTKAKRVTFPRYL